MPSLKGRSSPAVERRDRLTLAKLASYDDVATDALVDRAYFWTNTRKNRTKYIPIRGIVDDQVARILLHDVIVAKDASKAERELLAMPGLKKFMGKLRNDREKDWFRRHLRKYIQMYLPDSPFEITTTNRYTITEHEAAVCARKFIKQGQEIKYLSGTLVPMTREEEQDLDLKRKDFSIVMSSRKRTPSFFLGPARFANHDCNANGKLVTRGSEGMQVVATRDIYIGEEITVSYGDDYFGIDNRECLCLTCERLVRNGWSQNAASELPGAALIPAVNEDMLTVDSHVSPKKRKSAPDSETELSAPPTPSKRAKFIRQSSKLRSEVSFPESTNSIEQPAEQPSLINNAISNGPVAESVKNDPLDSNLDTTTVHTQPPSPDDYKSPSSITADESQRTSTSTYVTSVCDTGLKIKVEQVIETSVEKVSSTIEKNIEFSTTSQPDLERRSTSSERDAQSELSDPPSTMDLLETLVTETKKSRTSRRKNTIVSSVEVESQLVRVPGDYTKTSKLLAQTYDRWVDCHTCNTWFVQQNSYLTRRECPRCERHSMLYGYRWPKTDREGPQDEEERVMDHRTVHRFLYPEEESLVSRKARGVSFGVTPTPELSESRTETEGSDGGDDRRTTRASRRRTRSIRMTM
ncbi:SET domain-containing protein [Aspergillus clavatus NRRL 1]|uniref:Histone-lysine N-methyltransferase SET9 n=1 Tax=Aspergillus clavatus (strain ATCC 1007 / CBS 513.65 / DSM 816 / NCTC 3887 / NRRL 1 / QM 1276 / 107) TaxID=344612 RepID=A1CSR2_ASPCL|nr:SET domain protein [Aspergillus clavatus NRRL 1]EAW06349.1 SET domain protein [Aspergillus clavatus NRRL 1]